MSEDRVLAELSVDRAWKNIETMVNEFPSRLAGSEACWKAAGFADEQLRAAGVKSELMEYQGLVSFPGAATLEIISPEYRSIAVNVLGHSVPTGAKPIEGELVDADRGTWENCEKAGVSGKIAMTDLSYFPPRHEKQRNFAAQGALAGILLNWGEDHSTILPFGSVKPCWGNPTRLTMRTEMAEIPCLGVSRADGLALRKMCAAGKVKVRLTASCSNEWRRLRQAIGWVQGGGGSQEFAILGGHMDGWFGQAASDNASGNAIFIEIARVLQKNAAELKRNLAVGFWVGHETGTMIGSSHFVDTYWDELRENGVAYVQVDQPALKGTTEWETKSDFELQDYHKAVEKRILGGGWRCGVKRFTKIGDASFFGVGVPGIVGRSGFPAATVDSWGNANLGWWHHSVENTMDILDRESLGIHLKVYTGYLWGLLTTPILPARFTPTVKKMVDRLNELAPQGEPIKLAAAAQIAKEALVAAEKLDAAVDPWRGKSEVPKEIEDTVNSTLKALSRILVPLGGTVVGTYGHDPYGLAAQSTLLPGLYDLPRMNALPAQAEERELLFRELIRQRNRLADSMRDARDLASQTAARIGK
ncbi:MAG TPA: M28 family peptidase [Thermodesulfobacteriota bacterium]|nr:M28 family peptidase [Thermodesulfobacteriota bacterium]